MEMPAARSFTPRLIDALYVEALVLGDEVRSYFDGTNNAANGLEPEARVFMACESLRVSTRLMHCVAWLLARRGNPGVAAGKESTPRLGHIQPGDCALRSRLPDEAQRLIEASEELYRRIAAIDETLQPQTREVLSPARSLQQNLQQLL